MMEQARLVCSQAEASGLMLIPLKGAALNMGLPYQDLGLRSMCDLDLLAQRRQFEEIEALLRDEGYCPIMDRSYYRRHSHHFHYKKDLGKDTISLELHWTPLLKMFCHPVLEDEMFRRSRLHLFQGRSIRVLQPEDFTLGILMHLVAHRYRDQLKWLVDLAEVAHHFPLDWNVIWQHAERLGALRATTMAIMHAQTLLEAPIPPSSSTPFLLPLLHALNPESNLLTSQPQPSWVERALIDLLAYDSPAQGLLFLLRKNSELLERYGHLRLPDGLTLAVRSRRLPVRI
jgi:hypothetical protein